jgi:hypothetical protein
MWREHMRPHGRANKTGFRAMLCMQLSRDNEKCKKYTRYKWKTPTRSNARKENEK